MPGPKNNAAQSINIMNTAAKTNPNGRNTRAVTAVGHASHQKLGQSISYGIHRERTILQLATSKPNWANSGMAIEVLAHDIKPRGSINIPRKTLPTVTLIRRINLLCR